MARVEDLNRSACTPDQQGDPRPHRRHPRRRRCAGRSRSGCAIPRSFADAADTARHRRCVNGDLDLRLFEHHGAVVARHLVGAIRDGSLMPGTRSSAGVSPAAVEAIRHRRKPAFASRRRTAGLRARPDDRTDLSRRLRCAVARRASTCADRAGRRARIIASALRRAPGWRERPAARPPRRNNRHRPLPRQSRWNFSSCRCSARIQRTVPVIERITTVSVSMMSPRKRTPLSMAPVVTPVAANRQSPRTMSSIS